MNKLEKDKIEELKSVIGENKSINKKDLLIELEKIFQLRNDFKKILTHQAENNVINSDRLQSSVDTIRYIEYKISIYIELIEN